MEHARSKALSFAVVAMFVMTACCIIPSADAEEYGEGPYYINLFEGTHFEYAPGVNLSQVGETAFTVTPSDFASRYVTGNGTADMKISFTAPAENKTYDTVTITADWTVGEGSDKLTQSTQQKLIFKTYLKPYFTVNGSKMTSNVYPLLTAKENGSIIDTVTAVGSNVAITSFTVIDSSANATNDIVPVYNTDRTEVAMKLNTSNLVSGSYYRVTIVATGATEGASDDTHHQEVTTSRFTADITVGDSAVIAPSSYFAYYGEDDDPETEGAVTSRNVTYMPSTLENAVLSVKDSSDETIIGNGVVTDSKLSIVTDAVHITGTSKDVTFKINLKGTLGGQNVDVTQDCTLSIYANSTFLTAPIITEKLQVYHAQSDLKTVVASIDSRGALYAVYSWGDGSKDTVVYSEDSLGTVPAAHHTYEKDGLYQVTVTVYNDMGNVASSVGYSTYSGLESKEPFARIVESTKTIEGKEYIVLDGSQSVNAQNGFRWYKGASQTVGQMISTESVLKVLKSELKEGDKYTLVVENSAGSTNHYTYTYSEKQASGGDSSSGSKSFLASGYVIAISLIVLIVSGLAFTYFGVRTVLVGAVMVASAIIFVLSTGEFLEFFELSFLNL